MLRLEDAVRALADGGAAAAPTPWCITFDDGYADNLPAARTLAKYGATATFYITAGCLAGGQPFWPAELRHLVRGAARSEADARGRAGGSRTRPDERRGPHGGCQAA